MLAKIMQILPQNLCDTSESSYYSQVYNKVTKQSDCKLPTAPGVSDS